MWIRPTLICQSLCRKKGISVKVIVAATAQPRDHIPEFCLSTPWGNHTITHFRFAALIRLSTTTHNLLTFNTSEISEKKTRKKSAYWQINTSWLSSYTRLIQVPGWTVTRSADQHIPYFHTRKKNYRKIPKISPGAYIFQRPFWGAYFWRGLSTKGNLRFKIDWASLIVGSKITVFALFYFVFEGNFPSTSPRGACIWRGDLTEGFFALPLWATLEELIHGGAYFRYSWPGSKFTGNFALA